MSSSSKSNRNCNNCNKEIGSSDVICPYCGSNNINVNMIVTENIILSESIGTRKFLKNSKKWLVDTFNGFSPSGDKIKHPKGVNKTRIIDRENDDYHEKITDLETGKITRDIKEPLSEHRHK
jgi:hypothetical protein